MIRHVVLFRLLPGVDKSDANYSTGLQALKELGDQVSQIRSWKVQESVEGPGMWDVVLMGDFDSLAAVTEFNQHQAHVEAASVFSKSVEYAFADIEV